MRSAVNSGAPLTNRISTARFDIDYVGPVIGGQAASRMTRHEIAKFENAQSCERPGGAHHWLPIHEVAEVS